MNKPVSKLSVLFLFAILIPGTILTYFSIQIIASQRDLTEKRLLEDQNRLAAELSEQFHVMLTMYADMYFDRFDGLKSDLPEVTVSLDSLEFVSQAFVLNREGVFLWPNFYEAAQSFQLLRKTERFLNIFSSAESAEFAESDLKKATRLYQEANRVSRSKEEFAAASNGLARVLFKRGLLDRAFRQYEILVEKYGSVIDETGMPFGYYAIHQLILMGMRDFIKRSYTDVDHILDRIIEGEIPLTWQLGLLLESVEAWLGRLSSDIIRTGENLTDKIVQIRRFLSFIKEDGNTIKQISFGDQSSSSLRLGPYGTVSGSRLDKPNLIIFHDKGVGPYVTGFVVNLEHLKSHLVNSGEEMSRSLDLEIEIIPRNQLSQVSANSMSIIRELSPYTPSWRLWIRPEDPRGITQYIIRQRWIYGVAITLLMAGMVLGIVLVLRDVSREHKLAQLRSDFVSNVTHELKTPLTSIRMFADTMRLGRIKKKGEQQEYLSIIVDESERLTRLINNVLDFSKIEQGEKQYRFEPMNLSRVVEKAVNTLGYWLKAQGFHITSDIQPEIQTTADEDAIDQAILNLLSNAMKYSTDNKKIDIRLWQEDQSIYIKVEDRGIGIPESKQPFIFDKYYRAHTGHEKAKGGSGLGLTVVKHIIEAHQGRIEIKSEVNHGSTFTIILPKMQTSMREEKDMG